MALKAEIWKQLKPSAIPNQLCSHSWIFPWNFYIRIRLYLMQTNTHTQRIVLVRGRPAYRSVSGVFANACKNQSEAYWSTLLKTTENLMTACPLKALSCLTSCPWETVFCTLPFRHCLSSLSLQIYLSSPPCTLCPINWDTGNTLPISLQTPFNSGIAGGVGSEPCAFSRNEQPLMVGWLLSRNTQRRGSLQLSQLFVYPWSSWAKSGLTMVHL